MGKTTHSQCPVCAATSFSLYGVGTDHWLTHESFDLIKCDACTLVFTQDAPDQESIGKYYAHDDYVSHSNTSEGIFFKLYHFARQIMLKYKQKVIEWYTPKGKLLDIGAGTGYFTAFMQKNGWKTSGFEPDSGARKVAKETSQLDLSDSLNSFINTNEKFDAITLWHVLEHVHDLHQYFEHFNQLLNDKGTLFIAVPNYDSFDGNYYEENWEALDVPKHLWHFSPKSIQTLAEQHNFTVKKHHMLPFDPFYNAILSERNKGSKLGMFTLAPLIGYISFVQSLLNSKKAPSVLYVIQKTNS